MPVALIALHSALNEVVQGSVVWDPMNAVRSLELTRFPCLRSCSAILADPSLMVDHGSIIIDGPSRLVIGPGPDHRKSIGV